MKAKHHPKAKTMGLHQVQKRAQLPPAKAPRTLPQAAMGNQAGGPQGVNPLPPARPPMTIAPAESGNQAGGPQGSNPMPPARPPQTLPANTSGAVPTNKWPAGMR